MAAQNTEDNDRPKDGSASRQLRKILVSEQISAIDTDPNQTASSSTNELQDWINRLNRLDVPDPKATSEPQTPSENPQDVLLPPPVVAQESQSQKSPTAQKQQETNDPILDVVQEDPEAIAFPLKTADALFSNHDMEKALLYYQLALKNTDVGEANNDRPWALFQTANCLRRRDPIRAIEIYNQVISEYPGHTFSSMAKILAEIIQKQQTQNPIIVLERYGYDPNSL